MPNSQLSSHPSWCIVPKLVGACFLALIVLPVVLYTEENWRGAHAWNACERELTGKGEVLTWSAFVPPSVPDDRNLAMAPFFVRELHYQVDPRTHVYTFGPLASGSDALKNAAFAGFEKPSNLAPGGWDRARHTDLPGYQRAYQGKKDFPHANAPQSPADDVLLALTRYGPALDELAQAAAERPLSRFPVQWNTDNPYATTLPHYYKEQVCVQVLCLRASAAAGHTEDALRDLELSWRLSHDIIRDPLLIAHLVGITCVNMTLTPVWEGLADRRWSAAELARLQADLQHFDVLADFVATMRGERAYNLRGIDFLAAHPYYLATLQDFGLNRPPNPTVAARFCYNLIPHGWFNFNKVTVARHIQQNLIAAIDLKTHRLSLAKFNAEASSLNTPTFSFVDVLARMTLPTFDSVGVRSARLQTGLDEAVTACALERFFFDHQAYPARLDELVPGYLDRVPIDMIDGAPLRYHPTPDGRFQLYGIGWNARDDGGTVVWDAPNHLKNVEGDWVWQYTEPQPPPPAK